MAARISVGEIGRLKRKLADYLQRQKEVELRARSASSVDDRAALLQIAETWRTLASETTKLIADLQH